jgi:hypothetical protein
MSQSNVRFTANPKINLSSPPDGDRLVAWNSSSAEFELVTSSSSGTTIPVGGLNPQFATFYGTFAKSNDGTAVTLSGSDFTYHRVDTSDTQSEFRFLSSSDTIATAHFHPTRLENTENVTNISPISSYEYVQNFTRTAESAATIDLISIQTPLVDHEGVLGETRGITGSFSIVKIEHTAYVTGSSPRVQFMTHHLAWSKDGSNIASGLRNVTTETARIPFDEAIIDPRSVTASFNTDGSIQLECFHFALSASHNFRYTTL